MYQVIARKYRPQSFEDVVNQEHVKQTLINALTQGRVGHGYIFSGPRGTGKTTMARILAKALNCEKGPNSTPCQQCSSCREIAAGNSMDLVEIDAASNRRIDDIRELRENVRYRPVRDRYKVFIIDEAHQITADAFNALLKTLEEPPEWVVFILCTTEPQQFPATIVSRCQSFPFRTIDLDEVVGRLQWICEQEGVTADADALVAIALAGDGSIRDSLSTLDQAIASSGNKLEAAHVRDLLGSIPAEVADKILQALQSSDAGVMLAIVDRLAREGRHLQHFCGELTRYFRNLMVMKVAGADTRLVSAGPSERKRLAEWSEQFSQEDLTRYLNLLVELYRDLQEAPQPRFRLEIGLLKMVYAGRLQPLEKILAQYGPGGGAGSGSDEPSPSRKRSGAMASPATAEAKTASKSENSARADTQGADADIAGEPALGSGAYPVAAYMDDPPPAAPFAVAAVAGMSGQVLAMTTPMAGQPVGELEEDLSEFEENPSESEEFDGDVELTPSRPAQADAAKPIPPVDDENIAQAEPVAVDVAGDDSGPDVAVTKMAASDAPPAASANPASELQHQLAELLRAEGDHSLADALEHGRVELRGGVLEIRTLPDYRVVLDMGIAMIQDSVRALVPGSPRVTLGSDLAGVAPKPVTTPSKTQAARGDLPLGPPEAVERALADPDVQKIQKLFVGQIREVRNLRGYST